MKNKLFKITLLILIILLPLGYYAYTYVNPVGFNRFFYKSSSEEFGFMLTTYLSGLLNSDFCCPTDVQDLIDYVEYDLSIEDDSSLIEVKTDVFNYLQRNKKRLYLYLEPCEKRDTVVYLMFKQSSVAHDFFSPPISNSDDDYYDLYLPEDRIMYPFGSSYRLYYCLFRDKKGKRYFSDSLTYYVATGLKQINNRYIDSVILYSGNLYICRIPSIYQYAQNTLIDFLNGFDIDYKRDPYSQQIYNFLDTIAASNNLSSIITTFYTFEMQSIE